MKNRSSTTKKREEQKVPATPQAKSSTPPTKSPSVAVATEREKPITLQKAIIGEDLAALEAIIKKEKIDINDPVDRGLTPLYFAAYHGKTAAVEWLLNHGTSVDAKNIRDRRVMHGASEGNVAVVRMLLKAKAVVNVVDIRGEYPLHEACMKGQFDICQAFIEAGAKVNVSNKAGVTPLHIATRHNKADLIELLTRSGAEVDPLDCFSVRSTPLAYAIRRGHAEAGLALLKAGASLAYLPPDTVMPLWAGTQDKLLAAKKTDELVRQLEGSILAAYQSRTPLCQPEEAVTHHIDSGTLYEALNMPLVAMKAHCIEHGLDPENMTTNILLGRLLRKTGDLPLALECYGTALIQMNCTEDALKAFDESLALGSTKATKARLHYWRGCVLTGMKRWSEALAAYHSALQLYPDWVTAQEAFEQAQQHAPHDASVPEHDATSNEAVISMTGVLKDTPAPPQKEATQLTPDMMKKKTSTKNTKIRTVQKTLHDAIMAGNVLDIAIIIKKNKININHLLDNGVTPLFLAALHGKTAVVESLLKRGANVEAKNKDGMLAIQGAVEGNVEVVKMLLKANASVHVKDENNYYPIHNACIQGRVDICQALIEAGAKVNVSTITHLTPLHFAARHNEVALIDLLILNGAVVDAQENVAGYQTPLGAAIYYAIPQAGKALLKAGASLKMLPEGMPIPSWAGASEKISAAVNAKQLVCEIEESILAAYESRAPLPQPEVAMAKYIKSGSVYASLDQPLAALEAFNAARELDRDNITANILLGRLLRKTNNVEGALECYGTALMHMNCADDALKAFDKALELGSTNADVHYRRACVLAEMKRWHDALAACESALKVLPSLVEALLLNGEILENLGRGYVALAAYRKVTKIDPANVIAHQRTESLIEKIKQNPKEAAVSTAGVLNDIPTQEEATQATRQPSVDQALPAAPEKIPAAQTKQAPENESGEDEKYIQAILQKPTRAKFERLFKSDKAIIYLFHTSLEGTCLFTRLFDKRENHEVLIEILPTYIQKFAKHITANALCGACSPEVDASPLYWLASYEQGVVLLKKIFEYNKEIASTITGEVLCRKLSKTSGSYVNTSVVYWLCANNGGDVILTLLLDSIPQLERQISGDFLCLPLAMPQAPANKNISILFCLSETAEGHAILARLLNANPQLASEITVDGLCRVRPQTLPGVGNSSALFWLSETNTGQQILSEIFTHNDELARRISAKDLTLKPNKMADNLGHYTTLLFLARTVLGCSVLKRLFECNPQLVTDIPVKELCAPLPKVVGANQNFSVLLALSVCEEGCAVLEILLKGKENLAGAITAEVLCRALTNVAAGINKNRSFLSCLSESAEGIAILKKLLVNNPALAKKIDDQALNRTVNADDASERSVYSILSKSEKGCSVLQLLGKSPALPCLETSPAPISGLTENSIFATSASSAISLVNNNNVATDTRPRLSGRISTENEK